MMDFEKWMAKLAAMVEMETGESFETVLEVAGWTDAEEGFAQDWDDHKDPAGIAADLIYEYTITQESES